MFYTIAQREDKFNKDVQHHLNALQDLLDDNRETFNSQRLQDTLTLVKHAKNEWEGGMGSNKNAEPLHKWTEQYFHNATGVLPQDDDLDRCNCDKAGQIGHYSCGICEHNLPKFMCHPCFINTNKRPAEPKHQWTLS